MGKENTVPRSATTLIEQQLSINFRYDNLKLLGKALFCNPESINSPITGICKSLVCVSEFNYKPIKWFSKDLWNQFSSTKRMQMISNLRADIRKYERYHSCFSHMTLEFPAWINYRICSQGEQNTIITLAPPGGALRGIFWWGWTAWLTKLWLDFWPDCKIFSYLILGLPKAGFRSVLYRKTCLLKP